MPTSGQILKGGVKINDPAFTVDDCVFRSVTVATPLCTRQTSSPPAKDCKCTFWHYVFVSIDQVDYGRSGFKLDMPSERAASDRNRRSAGSVM